MREHPASSLLRVLVVAGMFGYGEPIILPTDPFAAAS